MRESKCSIASNDTALSRFSDSKSHALQTPLVWAKTLQYLAVGVGVLKGWKDIQTFIVG